MYVLFVTGSQQIAETKTKNFTGWGAKTIEMFELSRCQRYSISTRFQIVEAEAANHRIGKRFKFTGKLKIHAIFNLHSCMYPL